jgi:hypothetical protein
VGIKREEVSTVDDKECEGGHGQYSPDAVRRQYTLERRMDDAIGARALHDGVADVDVVRSAIAAYLDWPTPYVYPRAARWTKQTTPMASRQ